jgi:hypothetical protein
MAFESITHAKQRAFLSAYAELGNVKRAAKAAAISRESHYDWLAQSPEYAASFALAKAVAGAVLEDEAHRRAVRGTTELVVSQGAVVTYEDPRTGETKPVRRRRYSDSLLMMLLKGNLPDKYKERTATELSGPEGGAIRHQHEHLDYSSFSDDELAFLERLAEKAAQPRGD